MVTNTVYAFMFSLDTSDGERWELILFQDSGSRTSMGYEVTEEADARCLGERILQRLVKHAVASYRQSGVTARQVGYTSFPDSAMSDIRQMVQRDYGALCISTCNPEDGECILGFAGSNPGHTEQLTEEARFLVEELRFTLAPVYY